MSEVKIPPGKWAVVTTLSSSISAGYSYVEYLDHMRKYDWFNRAISEDEYNQAKLMYLLEG